MGDYPPSESPAEVRLAETTLETIRISWQHYPGCPHQKLARVIADGGYDSDAWRGRLARRGIELIALHHQNRRRLPTRDGRSFRRYGWRWIVERTIGWIGNYPRVVVRYDRWLTIYRGFFHIACFMIVWRSVLQLVLDVTLSGECPRIGF